MLLGNLYHILSAQQENGLILARIELEPGHIIFKGHFPHIAILPGVCQVQIMEEVLSHVVGKNMKLKQAAQIKFLSFVNPGTQKKLDLKLKLDKKENSLLFVEGNYIWEETIFLKLKGEFDEYRGA